MYAKCGKLDQAQQISFSSYLLLANFDLKYIFEHFKGQTHHDDRESVVTWTAMIQAYRMNGQLVAAWELFEDMMGRGIEPNEHIYSVILSVIAEMTNLREGKRIHGLLAV